MGGGNVATQQLPGVAAQQGALAPGLVNLSTVAEGVAPGTGTVNAANQNLAEEASGDPNQIAAAIQPTIQNATQVAQGENKQILQNTPRGGVQQLEMENVNLAKGQQIGTAATGAYEGAQSEVFNNALQAYGLSGSELTGAANVLAGQANTLNQAGQIQAQQKSAQLGLLGSLGGAAAMGAGTAMG